VGWSSVRACVTKPARADAIFDRTAAQPSTYAFLDGRVSEWERGRDLVLETCLNFQIHGLCDDGIAECRGKERAGRLGVRRVAVAKAFRVHLGVFVFAALVIRPSAVRPSVGSIIETTTSDQI
jgi:hypothetical protein